MNTSQVIDRSVDLLLQELSQIDGNLLLVADENWCQADWLSAISASAGEVTLISNRFDIARDAKAAGISSYFNDFDFSDFPPSHFDAMLFRISKERASSHHVINQASVLLKPEGGLLLSGEKNEGIKTYVKQACQLFGDKTSTKKKGLSYLASISLHSANANLLEDKNYPRLRPITVNLQMDADRQYISKPGIFGWNKIDRGSAFLIEHLSQFLSRYDKAPESLLDLGCGYGYLACEASRHPFTSITATDNNATALAAAKENLAQLSHPNCQVIAADAGDQLNQLYDTILCNPPFHQGFTVDDDLSMKFLYNSKQLLSSIGQALFVVNSFIPLEYKAKQYFRHADILANNGAFKLVALRQ
jgi:16S rRNA (guanine1207-N2)-methyltransferase